ncbi:MULTISPECIES: LLM class flavin-dependent oxidoreductase [unclassified Beijerinckia]|uniref:LLM class flavin-dependent oxidoreductase n=1 Tax=unclassified Beijerinckia TaxID=2638183 RepID=UPI00089D203B|nr:MULTISPECIES: LLM class flavin-dependent oxidoreductase [unclassified Beijerinckia]MDH7795080.1 alkanesulfonate monooxygenase SsuD/methylene tetrahydromethanopterin reductase-like flavin-dependent oxidoreductase (luciferase family) [Beijerinckia sp. GAS462]SEB86756.1 Flavin-dependent oxidoreductase, luciferase family (includes alkanesulfonate monooxygenase SsuD and methylene tetrahydromethanopterin reductase) [Beijerinckia sp. 28-YEA-48]
MKFGIFDHVDRSDLPLHEFYEQRLRMTELYDQSGFHGYHVAEHHFTPLGLAASPSVYLASVIQRTKNLRIGSLVYTLPLYHPLRLAEEICMLDHLSRGRLQVGLGRGISPIESHYYGEASDKETSRQVYQETLDILLAALTQKQVNYQGQYRQADNVPIELEPAQRPYPPLWMGVQSFENADFAAKYKMNMVCILEPEEMRSRVDRYRETWRNLHGEEPSRDMLAGLSLFIVVADSDAEAMDIADRCYRKWFHSFNYLYRLHGRSPMLGERADNFAGLQKLGRGIAGSPDTVKQFLRTKIDKAGINYLTGQFVFGDMSFEESSRSIDLFASHVMPALGAVAQPA